MMKTNTQWAAGAILLLAAATAALAAENAAGGTPEPAVSLSSLLEEMTDREAVTRWPAPAYTCQQASSHDRRKQDPADAAGWHSNVDHGQFIRTEVNQGRREWVIMEGTGPGAITRFWTPLEPSKESAIIRFYLDGAPEPAITARFNDLFRGCGFVRPPFAFVAWNETDLRDQAKAPRQGARGVAGDLYLPIPFAQGCRITLDLAPFYYVINYRLYESGTAVETFTRGRYEAAKATLKRVGDLLAAPLEPATGPDRQATLAPGGELALELPGGPGAVRGLRVRIDPREAPQALRSTIVEADFDGEATVWCPLGEFFGPGARLNPVQDWWRTAGPDGTFTARWVMPYQRSGRLALRNAGATPVSLTLAAAASPRPWDGRSLYFHARWRGQSGLPTRPQSDWNYLEAEGRGLYVGDTLTVFSPVAPWYGEGDERIFIDGEKTASHIGTGTEDYYGYAWGMAGFFNSPFIAMPQRDAVGQGNWRGYTTTSRVRPLDAIPWRSGIRHNMEIWHWADTRVDYAVGTFFYSAGGKHNRPPQPAEVARPLRETPAGATPLRIAGALECETLPIAAQSPGLRIGTQDAGLTEGQWSGERQLFVQATRVGDFVEMDLPCPAAKPRTVTIYGTRSMDYGILRFTINGQPAGKEYDAYAPAPIASGPIKLGVFQPVAGSLRLRIEVAGANAAAQGPRYYFGLDCVVLGQP